MHSKRAMQRLRRDFIDLQSANLSSIAARPLDDNLFEWHVNIRPRYGPYSGVYIHLILQFPKNYPVKPPTVKLCTTIKHPNVFGEFICLSMLRPESSNIPYEGWSGAYSVTSILMQLQSLLFAENIDQDGGYQIKATHSRDSVQNGIRNCLYFRCKTCSHSHSTPCPAIQRLDDDPKIPIYPVIPGMNRVIIDGTTIQPDFVSIKKVQNQKTESSKNEVDTPMDDVFADFGSISGRIFYEASIQWIDYKSNGGRIGWGFQGATNCGFNRNSIGYGGGGFVIYGGRTTKYGTGSNVGDTITAAIDFEAKKVYFAANGKLIGSASKDSKHGLPLPDKLCNGSLLYPLISFKDALIELHFGAPRTPCKWLMDRGFISLEEAAKRKKEELESELMVIPGSVVQDDTFKGTVDWHRDGVIDELWVWIFECLTSEEALRAQRVCTKWKGIMTRWNVAERHEMGCYFSKRKLIEIGCTEIMGIGLEIKRNESGYGVQVLSQMDILSKSAWQSGCRRGVWGENLTHFLPLVIDRKHSERAHNDLLNFLCAISCDVRENMVISNPNNLEKEIANNTTLQCIDSLAEMMSAVVVQFSSGNDDEKQNNIGTHYGHYHGYYGGHKTVSMMMCEKVVLGYCALHHLLLYLQSKNEELITSFADRWVALFMDKTENVFIGKSNCKSLGKLLIYTMISRKYQWSDIAEQFVYESFTRNIKWMVQSGKYTHCNTTDFQSDRLQATFEPTRTGHRLIMFQVWFSQINAIETLRSYNKRLGRPRRAVRDGIVPKTNAILQCDSWGRYLSDLGVVVKDRRTLDHLLRFSVYNSWKKGYHKKQRYSHYGHYGGYERKSTAIDAISPPPLEITSVSEAEKANRALFGNPAAPFTKEMGWIPPIRIPIESKSNDNALPTRSGPRRKFNLSSINSLIAPNEESQKPPGSHQQNVSSQNQPQRQSLSSRSSSSSFSRRTRNPVNPDSDDRFAGNWRSGPRKAVTSSFQERIRNAVKPSDRFSGNVVNSNGGTGSNVSFQRPPPKPKDTQSVNGEDMEPSTAYDSQSTTSVDTVNERNKSGSSNKPKRKRKRNRKSK